MSALIELHESAPPPAGAAPIQEQFTPLCERAVRSDGTIGIKIIGPGWGSSGYYGRDVLERDIPNIFPAGTQMFWNHATPTEEAERPEGDLNDLAAVTVSNPIWLDDGPKGPGMYADARPFGGYTEAIDEIGEHIGVSIRAWGRQEMGEAEGKTGPIITELVAGKSIDYVTVPGAGGAVVGIFESAGHGRHPAATVREGLANNDLRDRLVEKLKARFGGKDIYIWPVDWSVDDNWVVFEVNSPDGNVMYRLGMATMDNDVALDAGEPEAVRQVTTYVPAAPAGISESERPSAAQLSMEDIMSEQELQEAQAALTEAQKALAERDTAVSRLREQLILREARDFVMAKLAEAELPDITKTRLARELAANPPVKEGKLDEGEFGKRIDTAVAEATAEIAAIAGASGAGQITGMGSSGSAPGSNDLPDLAESQKRITAALAELGV